MARTRSAAFCLFRRWTIQVSSSLSVNSDCTKATRVKLCLIHQRQPPGVGTQVHIAAADSIIYEASRMRRAADQTEGRMSCHAAGFQLINGSNSGKLLWMRHQGEQIIVQSGKIKLYIHKDSGLLWGCFFCVFFTFTLTWLARQVLPFFFCFFDRCVDRNIFNSNLFSFLRERFVVQGHWPCSSCPCCLSEKNRD